MAADFKNMKISLHEIMDALFKSNEKIPIKASKETGEKGFSSHIYVDEAWGRVQPIVGTKPNRGRSFSFASAVTRQIGFFPIFGG